MNMSKLYAALTTVPPQGDFTQECKDAVLALVDANEGQPPPVRHTTVASINAAKRAMKANGGFLCADDPKLRLLGFVAMDGSAYHFISLTDVQKDPDRVAGMGELGQGRHQGLI